MINWLSKQVGLDHVGDPAVDDHAGVEDVGPAALDLLGELDVGDDEAEVVLRLHQQADAGVAEDGGARSCARWQRIASARPGGCRGNSGVIASPTT